MIFVQWKSCKIFWGFRKKPRPKLSQDLDWVYVFGTTETNNFDNCDS